jgi:D-alanine-D-alanine ligase
LGSKVVVKPSDQGSSVGVNIVKKKNELKKALDEAFKYGEAIVVEEFIEGIEISCGVLGNKELMVLPIVEVCPKNEFFDYESKYDEEKCEEIIPARIGQKVTDRVEELSDEIYRVMGCRGFARIDYIIREDVPYVLEINTIPGFTATSLLPKEAVAAGISYSELLDRVIDLALE